MSQGAHSNAATFAACIAILLGGPAAAQQYQVTDLGTTGSTTQTWALNASGQVAGYSDFLPDGHDEGFVYDGSTVHYIGFPQGTSRSDLLGINDLGEAAGKSGAVYENGQALLRRTDGTVLELGTLGGNRSAAWSINDASQVVGWSKLADGFQSRAFLWEDGVMDSLPVLGGTQAQANWINDAVQIVGSSTTDVDGLQQFGVLWENGTVRRLPPVIEGMSHLAWYIHDDGSIAGAVRLSGSGGTITRAAIWRNGELDLVLGTLADGTPEEPFASSVAHGVNATGVVVGMSVNETGANVPFVYFGGVMHQLDDLMPEPWMASYVGTGSVNDAGQIAVSAVIPGEPGSHALLLTPPAATSVGPLADADDRGGTSLSTHGRRITYRIARDGWVTISIFDPLGRLVARPLDGLRAAGDHEMTWDARTSGAWPVASGVYFVRMDAPGAVATDRITVVR